MGASLRLQLGSSWGKSQTKSSLFHSRLYWSFIIPPGVLWVCVLNGFWLTFSPSHTHLVWWNIPTFLSLVSLYLWLSVDSDLSACHRPPSLSPVPALLPQANSYSLLPLTFLNKSALFLLYSCRKQTKQGLIEVPLSSIEVGDRHPNPSVLGWEKFTVHVEFFPKKEPSIILSWLLCILSHCFYALGGFPESWTCF